jgi:hypothetical protein
MQKKWKKKLQKAERDLQAKAKSGRLEKLRDPLTRRGYRKLAIGDRVYHWRWHGSFVEIRTTDDRKLLVPIWKIQGFATEAAWLKEHEDCSGDDYCDAYWVAPRLIREHIDKTAGF